MNKQVESSCDCRDLPLSDLIQHSDMLDLLPMPAYVCDMAGTIKGYNRLAVALWGRSPLPGSIDEKYNGAYKLYDANGKYLPHDKTPAAACLTDGLPRKDIEVIIERPDHSRVHVSINVAPLKDGNGIQVGMINCFYDITSQKFAEKELEKKTLQLQDYVDNANIGLHWVKQDGVIKWANKAELDMLGYSREEYVGHHISEFHVSREKIEEILARLHTEGILDQYESELRCKDGSIKTVHISSSVFREDKEFTHTRCFTIDVTEQKRLNQALAESEMRYKSLVDSSPVAIYTCNKEGHITFFNEMAVNLWGYRPDINNASLKYCACYKVFVNDTLVLPDKTPMAVSLTTGQSFRNVQALVERPNGSFFFASVNIDPLYDEEKNIIGAINVFQDISELKIAEENLRVSESRYRHLVHTLDAPLYMTDAGGRITLFNQAAVDLWGRAPQTGVDLWCGSFRMLNTDGSDVPPDSSPMAVCLKEQRPVYDKEILLVRPDGTIRNVAHHPQPLFDDKGQMIGAINLLIDITDLKNNEKALLDSEIKYRSLANSLEKKVAEKVKELKESDDRYHRMVEQVEDYAIILLDSEGIIQNWNKGAEKIKGYKEAEIVGKSFQEFYLPEDRKKGIPLRLLQEARDKGKAIHEGWRRRSNGSSFWGSVVLTALHDDENNIIGFSKVTRDLTERQLAEDRMKEYLNQLEFQNKELEQFVYAASHDLKEPLRKIHIYNSYIADNPSNTLDKRSADYLARSISATERMKGLIEDLLSYSRATANIEGFAELDLNSLVDEILSYHKEEFEQKRVTVKRGDLGIIEAVPFQIKQLFSNLIGNAVKYRHPDRRSIVSITCELADQLSILEYTLDPDKKYYKISVVDNGIGFDTKYAGRIFEIFQRLDSVDAIKGSGIGLAICKKIVQNHNGYITADAKPGEGAAFFIYLPKEQL